MAASSQAVGCLKLLLSNRLTRRDNSHAWCALNFREMRPTSRLTSEQLPPSNLLTDTLGKIHDASTAFLDPRFYLLSRLSGRVVSPLSQNLGVYLGLLPCLSRETANLCVGVADDRNPLLVLPAQIRNIPHCNGNEQPAGCYTNGQRESCT
jgi:hypothetical protein